VNDVRRCLKGFFGGFLAACSTEAARGLTPRPSLPAYCAQPQGEKPYTCQAEGEEVGGWEPCGIGAVGGSGGIPHPNPYYAPKP
jgi:hypothetical protein